MGSVAKLASNIACIKYTLFCFNIVAWLIGAGLFAFSIYIRAEQGFDEWVDMLEIQVYYIGVYILMAVGAVVMIVSFLGCCSALTENSGALFLFTGSQVVCFILTLAGAAVLLDHSTYNSKIQPIIRDTMRRLIMLQSYPPAAYSLKMVQENIGCCGADGPNDYMLLKQPLPIECRDTVTGNAYFNGCVDEMTWFLEEKSAWAAAMAMALSLIHVVDTVLSVVLVQALKKEEEAMYRR